MLADIDRALKKATRCEHDFGNWLVILSGDEAEIEAGSDEDVPGGSDPIVRALVRARGGGEGDEAEIEAGSDEDVSVHVVSCLLLLDLSSLANAVRAC